jgi:hypothetical protein
VQCTICGVESWRCTQASQFERIEAPPFSSVATLSQLRTSRGASAKLMDATEEMLAIQINSDRSAINESDEVETVLFDDGDEADACTVCLSAKIDHTFLPCGHNSCCGPGWSCSSG